MIEGVMTVIKLLKVFEKRLFLARVIIIINNSIFLQIIQMGISYCKLYFQNCKQLEAGETTPLLKTADMNQNESAKGDRGKGLPSVKC